MRSFLTISLLLFLLTPIYAQRRIDADEIKVLARPYLDSITLRWAPESLESWIKGNQFGYTIERFTMIREKKVLSKPERKIISSSLRPRPLDQWEALVRRNKHAAIAAQALYGESFQLTTQGTDVFQIVNKVKENEQRFSIALFAADMSSETSTFLGLRFTDKDVKKGEKYLYRLTCIVLPESDTLRGSIFIAPEKYTPPVLIDFTAEFKGDKVSMKWDQSYYRGVYSAFVVERSGNGMDYKPLSAEPVITLSEQGKEESRYQYAMDSLPDQTSEYYYRVRGLTPFGELGPPSQAVAGRGSAVTEVPPYIIKGTSENNQSIKIEWQFPLKESSALKGFIIKRAENPRKQYKAINPALMKSEERMYEDLHPMQTNYYQVVAVSNDGKELKSPVYYAQLVDSIPPSSPKGLTGKVTEQGKIAISWTGNTEPDIYGYRIYRGNSKKEEFSQITREPIPRSLFIDSVSLNTLNKQIHYQVMAIDRNQNYSALSEVLSLDLPDKVKPVSPVFLPTLSSREGVTLQWTTSSSDDVGRYDLYRREGHVWKKIFSQLNLSDSIYSFSDKTTIEGKNSMYTVVAVDQAGNESEPAAPVRGSKLIEGVKPPVVLRSPSVDRTNKRIVLKWNYEQPGVDRYQIYRAKDDQPLKLLTTITASNLSFEDSQLSMNSNYTYCILALFVNGAKSELSRELMVTY